MTEQEQQIAIAEACGWSEVISLNNCIIGWPASDRRGFREMTPDYLHDLNAMHEAEKILTPAQKVVYAKSLFKTTPLGTWMIFATAIQRAEAFLRTLNRWKD